MNFEKVWKKDLSARSHSDEKNELLEIISLFCYPARNLRVSWRPNVMQQPRRNLIRISLAGLIFLMTCVAGFFAGFHYGQAEKKHQQYLTTLDSVDYEIDDLMFTDTPHEEVASMIEYIRYTVKFSDWQPHGENSIKGSPTSGSPTGSAILHVSATGEMQDRIVNLLAELRTLSGSVEAKEILPYLQAMNVRKDTAYSHVVRAYPKTHQHNELLLSKQFAMATEFASQHWGKPSFMGESTHEDFPDWSTAYRLATWPKEGGIIFIELREVSTNAKTTKPDSRCLAVGWHADKENDKFVIKYHWDGPVPE